MSSLLSLLRAGDELLSRVVRAICVVAMASIFIMFILNVFVRFVPIYNFTQTDDWIQFALVWMIFLGAQELVRTRWTSSRTACATVSRDGFFASSSARSNSPPTPSSVGTAGSG